MAKLTLIDIANLQNETSVVAALATNNARIEAAVENTLSRDGTTPNEMNDDLDMNNHRIYNLPEPLTPTEPLRLSEFSQIKEILDNLEEFEEELEEALEAAELAQETLAAFLTYYLGAFPTDPTTDLAGNPLQVGALYWNTSSDELKVWDGAAWQVPIPSGTGDVAANSIRGNNTGAVAPETDLTVTQVTAMLNTFTASTVPAVGLKGLVPALAAGQVPAGARTLYDNGWGVTPLVTISGTTAAAIQAQLDAIPAGSTVLFPAVAYTLAATVNITKALNLLFAGGTFTLSHDDKAFLITASKVSMTALARTDIIGTRTTNAYVGGAVGIYSGGTTGARLNSVHISGPFVISQFKGGGFRADFTDQSSIKGVWVTNVTFFGMFIVSCNDFHCDGNKIETLRPEGILALGAAGQENAYGISVTRGTGSLIADTVPYRNWITNNIISGVQTWTAIDTHGGSDLFILGNQVTNCKNGMYLTLANVSGGTYVAPDNLVVQGNKLSGVAYGTGLVNGWGIFVSGLDGYSANRINIVDNIVVGFGWNGTGGQEAATGINASAVNGLIVANNQVIDCRYRGIQLAGGTAGTGVFAMLSGNYIQSMTAVAGGQGVGIECSGAYVSATLASGMFYSMDYAVNAPSSPASGNFGLFTARAIGMSQLISMWLSSTGRIDLGATAI